MVSLLKTVGSIATEGFTNVFRIFFSSIYEVEDEQVQFANEQPAEPTLVKLILYYRHGSRGPYTDPSAYNIETPDWPDGLGELTKRGKKQCYVLGKRLRKRYDKILTSNYSKSNIIAKSTNTERTIISTSLVLAGMYPPQGYQIWNEDLQWQPIPVYVDQSPLKCFTSRRLLYEFLKNRPDELVKKMESLSLFIQETCGHKLKYPDCPEVELLLLLDMINFLKLYNVKLPNWAHQYWNNHFPTLLEWFKCKFTNTMIQKQLSLSVLGDNILNFADDPRKVLTHCVHDINIVMMNLAIGSDIKLWPDTTSCVAIEFHEHKGKETVKAFYITNAEGPIVQLEMACGIEPTLSAFKDMLLSNRPENYDALSNTLPEKLEVLDHKAYNMVYTFTS